jgi:hypothetical protein
MKIASVLSLFLALVVGQKEASAQTFQCPICGDGKNVTDAGAIVQVPEQLNRTCAELLFAAESGFINETQCTILQPLALMPCCATQNPTVVPTAAPTTGAPSLEPSFGPAPDCFTDLDNLSERELAVTDLSVPRTLILCPDTDYYMGRADDDNPGTYVGGYSPFVPRPNAHYKCGESGSSSNNCRIIDGDFPILSFGGDLEHTNITFQGLIIESAFRGGMIFARAGDLTFTDCIIRVSLCIEDR